MPVLVPQSPPLEPNPPVLPPPHDEFVLNPYAGTVPSSRFCISRSEPTENSGTASSGTTQAKFSASVSGSYWIWMWAST